MSFSTNGAMTCACIIVVKSTVCKLVRLYTHNTLSLPFARPSIRFASIQMYVEIQYFSFSCVLYDDGLDTKIHPRALLLYICIYSRAHRPILCRLTDKEWQTDDEANKETETKRMKRKTQQRNIEMVCLFSIWWFAFKTIYLIIDFSLKLMSSFLPLSPYLTLAFSLYIQFMVS